MRYNWKKSYILLISFLVTLTNCWSQEPSYFTLGEEELEGIDIYDVIQDNDKNYWFATDHGLFVHDGYSFKKVTSDQMKASSIFSLEADSKGRIYCYNLSHQIFRIENGQIKLFYEIPEEERLYHMSIAIDSKDHVLIQSKSIVRVSPDGQTNKLIERTNAVLPLLDINDRIYAFENMNLNDKVAKIINGQLSHITLSSNSEISTSEAYYWDKNQSSNYLIGRNSLTIFELTSSNDSLISRGKINEELKGQVFRPYTVENQIWVAGQTKGVYLYDSNFEPIFNGKRLLNDYFISDVYQDHEGNILLSTFDKGILVIPNTALMRQNIESGQSITRIEKINSEELLLGDNDGNVLIYKDNEQIPIDKNQRPKLIETLHYWSERDVVLYDVQGGFHIVDQVHGNRKVIFNQFGSLKTFAAINDREAILGFNNGLRLLSYRNGVFTIENKYRISDRIYSIAYDPKQKVVYAGTAEGIKKVYIDGRTKTIRHKNKSLFANYLCKHNGRLFVGTKRHGVLILKDDSVESSIEIDDQVMKIVVHEDLCFINARSGFYLHNLKTKVTSRLNQTFGLRNRKIVDFHIANNALFVSGSNGLQFLPLDKLNPSVYPIPINKFSVSVDGKTNKSRELSHNRRKIRFDFSVSTLKHRDDITYLYRLEGYESGWRELPYNQNHVEYNSLAPGDYTFLVKTRNQNKESAPIRYSFTVSAPFYLKWWFYLSITLGAILIMVFVFRRRLKLQEKRARQEQELNASKLTAIQSQMNPHFIFNALNSIQDLVIQGDSEKSYSFITKFANLVRKTLNHSDKDFIDLEEEIKLLEIYLSLEKLRFKEDFEYSLLFEEFDGIKIPPMLIQPFIENALIHGLLHKEGIRKLTVEFDIQEHLICTVTDNGIGRDKAREIKSRQGSKHESFAISAIKRRMVILKKRFGDEVGFTYEDIYENGAASGTKVVLRIPVERSF